MNSLRFSSSLYLLPFCALLLLTACGDDDSDSGNGSSTSATSDTSNTSTGTTGDSSTTSTTSSTSDTSNTSTGTTGDTSAQLPPQPWDPEEPGYYNVGYRTESLTYTPEGSSEERTLRVVFWYPTLDEDGEDARYLGILGQPGVFDNASVAIQDEPAPLLVFSHGSTSFAEQSYFMTEFFASHGWVIVAMDHTGNTYQDDGIPPEIFARRPQDITATLDYTFSLSQGDPLHQKISTEHIALTGHSFGGYTTLAASGSGFQTALIEASCEANTLPNDVCDFFEEPGRLEQFEAGFGDDRIKIAMPQAPFGGPVFGSAVADIDIPVLLFTGALDRTLPPSQDGDPIWDGLDGEDDIRIDFATGGHFTFSNACELGPQIGENDGCGDGFVPFDRAYQAINAYALIFAQHHLFGVDTHLDVLNGERILDEDIIFSTK